MIQELGAAYGAATGDAAVGEAPRQSPWLRVGIGLAPVASLLLIGAGYLIGTGLSDDDGLATAQAGGDPMQYVTCMRENGVPDFPDPVNGMFNYDARTDAARAADAICRKFLPSDAPPPPE